MLRAAPNRNDHCWIEEYNLFFPTNLHLIDPDYTNILTEQRNIIILIRIINLKLSED